MSLDDKIAELEKEFAVVEPTVKVEINVRRQTNDWDFAIWLFGIASIVLALIFPIFQLGYFFGVGVLSTLLVKSNLIRGLALLFDLIGFAIIFFLSAIGVVPPTIGTVITVVLAINTWTLFPLVASMIALGSVVLVAVASTRLERYLGIDEEERMEKVARLQITLIIISFILAFLNALTTVPKMLFTTWVDILTTTLTYFGIFLFSYLVIFAIAYLGYYVASSIYGKMHFIESYTEIYGKEDE